MEKNSLHIWYYVYSSRPIPVKNIYHVFFSPLDCIISIFVSREKKLLLLCTRKCGSDVTSSSPLLRNCEREKTYRSFCTRGENPRFISCVNHFPCDVYLILRSISKAQNKAFFIMGWKSYKVVPPSPSSTFSLCILPFANCYFNDLLEASLQEFHW